jgi:hypothetical protein
MPDPLSSTIIGSLIKGLLDIATRRLPELFKGSQPSYAMGERFYQFVYDLHVQLGLLKKEIGQLIEVFDLLLLDTLSYHDADRQLEPVLVEIRRTLATIDLDVRSIKPGFEIHASDIAPLIEVLIDNDEYLVCKIGLTADLWLHDKNSEAYENEVANFKTELRKLRDMAATAQKAIGQFAREF